MTGLSIEDAIARILQACPACGGRVSTGAVKGIAALLSDANMGVRCEREDVLAYLEQRRDAAATMARKSAEFEDTARERARQLSVMIGDLRGGLHEGAASVRAALAGGEEKDGPSTGSGQAEGERG